METFQEILEKPHHDAVNSFATDEQVEGAKLFGLPLLKYTKKELSRAVIHFAQECERLQTEHNDDIKFIASIK